MFENTMRAPTRFKQPEIPAPPKCPYVEERRPKLKEVIRRGEIMRELRRSGVGARLKYQSLISTGKLTPLPKIKKNEAARFSRDQFLQILTGLLTHANAV